MFRGVPCIERSELKFDPKLDEIGKGTFGYVYKVVWAGAEVAVKKIKVRNVQLMKTALETEMKIHSRVRLPNIAQIMAISLGKNVVYIVCELVDGYNLEDLLFGEEIEDDENAWKIPE